MTTSIPHRHSHSLGTRSTLRRAGFWAEKRRVCVTLILLLMLGYAFGNLFSSIVESFNPST